MPTLNDVVYKTIVAKRKNPYEGNNVIGNEMESETASQNFAKGGMTSCPSCGGNMAEGGMSCAKGCKMAYGGKMAEGGPVDKKKAAVMAIVAKIGKKPMASAGKGMDELAAPEMEMEEEDMPVSEEAKMAAAEEVMGALKSGDVKMFAGALENFLSCCGGMED
jgi:hypothetical protein